jgi:hypothetical protein
MLLTSRKSTGHLLVTMMVLLSVLLALAPVAGAAPETVSSVTVTSPTALAPAYVKAGQSFTVNYTINEVAVVANPVEVQFYLGTTWLATDSLTLALNANALTKSLTVPAGTADGIYDVVVKARDAGQTLFIESGEHQQVVIDTTAPTIAAGALIYPNGGEFMQFGSTLAANDIAWDATKITQTAPNATPISLYLSCDGGATFPYTIVEGYANTSPYDWTPGPCVGTAARVKLVAKDNAGNMASVMSAANFTIFATDTSAPNVTLTAPAAAALVKGTINVAATATDLDSGITKVDFQYSKDGGATWLALSTDFNTPYQATFNTTTVADGTAVIFRAIATNGVGGTAISNVSPAQTVDNSAPTVAVTAPAAGAILKLAAFAPANNAADPHSGITGVVYEYRMWNAAAVPPAWGAWGAAVPAGDGVYEIRATATNGVGLTTTSAAVGFTIDSTAPQIPADMLIKPNGGEAWELTKTYAITWKTAPITETNLAANPISLKLYKGGTWLKDIATGLANTGTYNWLVTGVPTGLDYKVEVVVTDKAGNTASDQSNANFSIWIVDNTPPTVALTAPAAGLVGVTVPLAATATDAESGIVSVSFWYSTDGIAWTEIPPADTAAPYAGTWNPAASGAYWLKARATNGVLNAADSASVKVTVDAVLPAVAMTQPAAPATLSGLAAQLYGTASDAGGLKAVWFEYGAPAVKIADGVATGNPNEFGATWNTVALADGLYNVRICAKDNALNVKCSTDVAVTIDNTPVGPVGLARGWNLVSLPVMPYDASIASVLSGVSPAGCVKQVRAWVWEGGKLVEKIWSAGPKTLTTMVDGQGYWLETSMGGCTLTVKGTVAGAPPAPPVSYNVYTGWNMIGFTSTAPKPWSTYLGSAGASASALYDYDEATGAYLPLFGGSANLLVGQGYWLAMSANSTIYP